MPFDTVARDEEEALLLAYGRGEAQAARALTERLAPMAYRVAARMLGDWSEAEDVAQEAMLRLWRVAPEWRAGEAKVSTWLYRVVSNLATDRLRRRRGAVALDEAPEPEDEAPAVEAVMVDQGRMEALQAALLTLPERQRQAVILRHLEGLSNPEIAVVMEIGVEAVESLTARGKRALALALAGRKEELGYAG